MQAVLVQKTKRLIEMWNFCTSKNVVIICRNHLSKMPQMARFARFSESFKCFIFYHPSKSPNDT